MNDKENHIIYNAADIEKYLSGKLTPLQMHAMEKAALDDEFLAEAIEGYALIKEADWKNGLAGLRNRFENDIPAAKVIDLPVRKNNSLWKAIAAVLIIGTTATLSYLALNKKEPVQLAQETNTVTPPAPTAAATDTKPANESIPGAQGRQETPVAVITDKKNAAPVLKDKADQSEDVEMKAISKAETEQPGDNFIYKPGKEAVPSSLAKKYEAKQSADDELVINEKVATQVQANNAAPATVGYNSNTNAVPDIKRLANSRQAENGVVMADKDQSGLFKKQQSQQYNRYFSAQVLAPDNTPLPFANISIKNENFGTYADVKGNFRLVSADSIITVEVKAAGYQPQFYTLQSYIAQNKIVLKEEDVSTRYKAITANPATAKSKASRKATLIKDSVVNVEPADGWDNYNTYVNNNIEIPDDILDKNLHGQVQLSFDIKPNGTITNIKVDKSLCNDCDEAAKRLIEQGPQWKTKNGKKGKGKVVVQF